jgi:membrane protease YdiL (CAAX protease family)
MEPSLGDSSGPGPGFLPGSDNRTFLERHGITPVTFGYLSVVFFFVVYQLVGSAISIVLFGISPDLNEPDNYRLFQGLAQVALLLLPAILLARLASHRPLEYLRLRRPSLPVLLVPLAGVFSLQQMLQVYLYYQGKIPLPPEVEKLVSEMKQAIDQALVNLLGAQSFTEFLGVVLVIAVIPAVAEEFVFRGLIQKSFERGIGPARGIATAGIIFAAFHLNPFSIVPLIALGVYLGFLAHRAGSIWVSAGAHFFNNFIPVAALHFGLADQSIITGDMGEMSFPMLMLTFWFSGVIFLLSTYSFIHLTRKPAGDARWGAPQ